MPFLEMKFMAFALGYFFYHEMFRYELHFIDIFLKFLVYAKRYLILTCRNSNLLLKDDFIHSSFAGLKKILSFTVRLAL